MIESFFIEENLEIEIHTSKNKCGQVKRVDGRVIDHERTVVICSLGNEYYEGKILSILMHYDSDQVAWIDFRYMAAIGKMISLINDFYIYKLEECEW